MIKKYIFVLTLFIVSIFTGCAPTVTNISKGEYHSKLYSKHPKSILVLPARNTTTSVDATEHFRYTITQPLTEKGYYVFPVHLVDNFFKSENLVDAEQIRNIPLNRLKEVFNPDAILYVDINAWDTGYTVVNSHVDVGISFSLIDANSGEEIWQNNAYAYSYDGLDGNNGIIGLVVSAITVAINTATDYTKLSYTANASGTYPLPVGNYHELYKKDTNINLTFQNFARHDGGKLFVDEYFIKGNGSKEPVALTARGYLKGYHAFSVDNINFLQHNGYNNYYLTQEINGRKFLKNRFFNYENNKPFLFVENKKIFVYTENDGKIPYSEEDGKYYFQIANVKEFK